MTFPAQQVENAPPAKKSYSGIANMLVKRKISIGNQTVNAWSGQLGTQKFRQSNGSYNDFIGEDDDLLDD